MKKIPSINDFENTRKLCEKHFRETRKNSLHKKGSYLKENEMIIIAFYYDSPEADEEDAVAAYIDDNPPTDKEYEWIGIDIYAPDWEKVEYQIQELFNKIKERPKTKFQLCDMKEAIDDPLITDHLDELLYAGYLQNKSNLTIPQRIIHKFSKEL